MHWNLNYYYIFSELSTFKTLLVVTVFSILKCHSLINSKESLNSAIDDEITETTPILKNENTGNNEDERYMNI